MTATTWAILGAGVGIGAVWIVFVALEFTRLRRMHRETMERLRQEEKARK